MNWRWLIFDFIDPRLDLTRAERLAIRARTDAAYRARHGRPPCRFLFLMGAMMLPMIVIVPMFTLRMSAIPILFLMPILIVVSALVGLIIDASLTRKRLWPALHESMQVFGHDVCIECARRFKLNESDADACPSCGDNRLHIHCYKCGYDLGPPKSEYPPCPECGMHQRRIRVKPRTRTLRQVDRALHLLPARTRRGLRGAAWRRSSGQLCMVGAAAALLLAGGAWVYYQSIQPEPGGLRIDYLAAITPLAFIGVIFLIEYVARQTLGGSFRSILRERGHEVCERCGTCLHDIDARVTTCPRCSETRCELPADVEMDETMPDQQQMRAIIDTYHRVRWRAETDVPLAVDVLILLVAIAPFIVLFSESQFLLYAMMLPIMMTWLVVREHRIGRAIRRHGLRVLRKQGCDVCPQCGAWLTGDTVDTPRCPDCNWWRRPVAVTGDDSPMPSEAPLP